MCACTVLVDQWCTIGVYVEDVNRCTYICIYTYVYIYIYRYMYIYIFTYIYI